MSILWGAWKRDVPCGSQQIAGWMGRLAGVALLALALCLAAGMGQASAAAFAPNKVGGLAFTSPNNRGVYSGPPGTKVTVHGSSWQAYGTVELSLSTNAKSCSSAVSVGSFATDGFGSFSARFLWPAAANHVGAYYACGYQAGKGIALSHNNFMVLASSPAAVSFTPSNLVAGSVLNISGSNWLPGPQTLVLVVTPCNTTCPKASVAQAEITTGNDGTFHQQLTISASATSGAYYIQATNTAATISATSSATIQVTGQTPPGATVTPTPTPITKGGPITAPPSQAKAALKDAVLAAGLGLLALLALLGGLVFFVRRTRDADAPMTSAARKEERAPESRSENIRRATWREKPASIYDTRLELPAMKQPSGRPVDDDMLEEEDVYTVSGVVLPAILVSGDHYPWERQAEEDPSTRAGQPYQPQANPPAGQSPHGSLATGAQRQFTLPPHSFSNPSSDPEDERGKEE